MCTFFGYFLYIKKRESQIPAPNAKPAFYLSPPTESSGTVSPEVHVPSTATMGPLFFRSLGAIRNHENWNICLYLHLKNINLSKIVVVFFLAVPWEIYGKCFEEIDVPKKKCSEKKSWWFLFLDVFVYCLHKSEYEKNDVPLWNLLFASKFRGANRKWGVEVAESRGEVRDDINHQSSQVPQDSSIEFSSRWMVCGKPRRKGRPRMIRWWIAW